MQRPIFHRVTLALHTRFPAYPPAPLRHTGIRTCPPLIREWHFSRNMKLLGSLPTCENGQFPQCGLLLFHQACDLQEDPERAVGHFHFMPAFVFAVVELQWLRTGVEPGRDAQ